MKRIGLSVPLLLAALCGIASAEQRASRIGASIDDAPAVSLIGFFHGHRGGYGCGCDVAAPSCGAEVTCAAAPSCGYEAACGGDYWGDYCATRGRKHCGLFHRHRHRGCGFMDAACGCDAVAPSCGLEATCAAAPSCGYDAGPMCGGGHRLFGHHCRGFGGCFYGCGGHRCGHVCKPIRFWANGWCGQVADGLYGGNPPDCGVPDMMPGKALPPPPLPLDEPPPVPEKSTLRSVLPNFSRLPIGAGLR